MLALALFVLNVSLSFHNVWPTVLVTWRWEPSLEIAVLVAAYLALQSALMRRFLARGGTAEEFCERLAPTYHRRYAPLVLGEMGRESLRP